MEEQTVEVEVTGHKVKFKCTGDSPMTDSVVELVRSKVTEAGKRVRTGTAAHQIILLALFDVAEEYLMAKKRVGEYNDEVSKKSSQLTQLIESEME